MASLARRIKRGTLKMIWNETFKRYDFYRKTSKGFCQTNPFVPGSTLGPTISKKSRILTS